MVKDCYTGQHLNVSQNFDNDNNLYIGKNETLQNLNLIILLYNPYF